MTFSGQKIGTSFRKVELTLKECGGIVFKSGEALRRVQNRAFAITTVTSEIEKREGEQRSIFFLINPGWL